MKFITCFTLLCSFVLLTSCGNDGLIGDCSSALLLNTAFAEESDKLSTALTSFSTDQSNSNCDNLKNAYGDYINALKSLEGCANEVGVGDDFRSSITEAESNLDTIGC